MNPWFAKQIVYRSIGIVRREAVLKRLREIHALPFASREEIGRLQQEKLARVLQHANASIGYYRDLFARNGIDVEMCRWPDDLGRIPLLRKQTLQEIGESLQPARPSRPVSKESTSGTLGAPLVLAIDRHKSAFIRAVMFRNYGWYGIDVGDRQARFWGMPAGARLHYREELKDLLANRIRLSAFAVDEAAFHRFAAALRNFRPRYFYGYPSLLFRFASWVSDNRVDTGCSGLAAIITSGELLHDFQRRAISEAFHCPVVNEYGTTETGIIAFECAQGMLHINSDHLYVECLESEPFAGQGNLVITELNNLYNPLIRYQLGDLGAISEEECSCGCAFPVLKALSGREGNFITTPSGRQVFSAVLSYTFKEGVRQFQGIQRRRDELIVRIVREEGLSDALADHYKESLARTLGDGIKVTFEFVPRIEPEKSGKLRYFISDLTE